MFQTHDEYIVTVSWLAQYKQHPHVVIADCRYDLGDVAAGRKAYEKGHIPGAIFFDLSRDLSSPVVLVDDTGQRPGGRHPLPSVEQLTTLFSQAGIDDQVTVVCYDDAHGSRAGRLWWLLRFMGHERVVMLDGGYQAWQAVGYSSTQQISQPCPTKFTPRPQYHMVATMDEVKRISESGEGIIIDSRAPERFQGETELLDARAGHIPGALNVPWENHLTSDGTFATKHQMAQRFSDAGFPMMHIKSSGTKQQTIADDIIVHCGSGITGCVNILALTRCGVPHAKLYVGGWSEWSTYSDNPIARVKP